MYNQKIGLLKEQIENAREDLTSAKVGTDRYRTAVEKIRLASRELDDTEEFLKLIRKN